MQSNKPSKKTSKIAAENIVSPENAADGETMAKPRTSKSSKPKSENGETASMKLHRKATSSPTQETASTKESSLLETNTSSVPKTIAASAASSFNQERATTVSSRTGVTHDEIARLAHAYSLERGHRHGSPEEDWLRAERELLSRP